MLAPKIFSSKLHIFVIIELRLAIYLKSISCYRDEMIFDWDRQANETPLLHYGVVDRKCG